MEVSTCYAAGEAKRERLSHRYTLNFHANALGVAKRVELTSEAAKSAIDFAISDTANRVVDVWQDGEFLCRVSRDQASNAGAHLDAAI